MTIQPNRVIAGLVRAELAGITPHTLAVAFARCEGLPLDTLSEREFAIELLTRANYPESINEFSIFLSQPQALSPATLNADAITALHAPHYMRWLPAFLDDPDVNIQKNARLMLRWLVANRRDAIHNEQECLDNLRRIADDSGSVSTRNSGFVAYALGCCGSNDDYERVIRHAELVIEHDREHLDLVAEGLYRLYPPALINALQFFLERTNPNARKKEFATGMVLLSKVAEIEDREFWKTYYNEMDALTQRLGEWAVNNSAVERVLDQIEKQMVLTSIDDEA